MFDFHIVVLLKLHGIPAVVLIHGGLNIVVFDIAGDSGCANLFAGFLIGIDLLPAVIFVAEDALGGRNETGTVFNLVKSRNDKVCFRLP